MEGFILKVNVEIYIQNGKLLGLYKFGKSQWNIYSKQKNKAYLFNNNLFNNTHTHTFSLTHTQTLNKTIEPD